MKRTLLFLFCSVFALAITAKTVTPAASLPAYYQQIDGKAGKTLFDAVQRPFSSVLVSQRVNSSL